MQLLMLVRDCGLGSVLLFCVARTPQRHLYTEVVTAMLCWFNQPFLKENEQSVKREPICS